MTRIQNDPVFNSINTALSAYNSNLTNLIGGTWGEADSDLTSKILVGQLSESGAGTDTGFNEDYSTTSATFCAYLTTATSYIYRMVLSITLGDVDETTAKDNTLFLGGGTALSVGIKWGVDTADDFGTATISSNAAKTIEQFATLWGADINRFVTLESATNTVNSDNLIVTLDFVKMFGSPIVLATGEYIGIYLNDDLSSAVTTFTGSVIGRID